MKRLTVLTLFILGLLLLSTPMAAMADSIEGFDSYQQGSASSTLPATWTFATNIPTCWSQPAGLPPTGVVSLPNQFQPSAEATTSVTNAFEFNFNPNCYALNTYASISIQINMSSYTLFLSWWQSMITVNDPGTPAATANGLPANTAIFTALIDGSVVYSNDTSGIKKCGCWNEVLNDAGIPEQPGSIHTITFKVQVVPYVDSYSFSFAIDTIAFTNSNPVIPNHDFNLINYGTGQWFNLLKYTGTSIAIQYKSPNVQPPCTAGALGFNIGVGRGPVANFNNISIPAVVAQGTSCVISNLITPDIIVPGLAYANLITVTVGTSYQRTLIPCSNPLTDTTTCTSEDVILDQAANVLEYTISISDVTGQFGVSGTQIYVYLSNTLITSGYLDTQTEFPAALVPGKNYEVILVNGAGTQYITTITPGASSGQLTIPISSVKFGSSNTSGQLALAGMFACTGSAVAVEYNDTLGETTKVTLQLYNRNVTGSYLLDQTTVPVSLGSHGTEVIYPVNSAVSGTDYYVQANATRNDGTFPQLGPFPVFVAQGCPNSGPVQGGIPNFPSDVLGLGAILPNNPSAWLNILSLLILFMTAALFGARAAGYGAIFVVIEAGILSAYLHWLPYSVFYLDMFLIVTVITFLATRARRKYT